jgi:pSer/pThr/pTyr-binding forkhead associated (FHA) protein
MVQSLQNSESARYATGQLNCADAKYLHTCTTMRFSVWDNSVKIDVPLNQECVIGRASKEEPLAVDLTPFNAHVLGVSRKHAMIKPIPNGCCIIDLKSTNGTLLNNTPLVPHQAYLLKSGDEIQVGGVYLQVSFF